MEILILMIVGVVGITIGFWLSCFMTTTGNKPSGTFVIDVSDPMKDVCRFEMDESLDSIYSKKQIILNVKTFGDFSPK